MRLRTSLLKRRVNGDLMLRYQAAGLTSYAGLELLRRFCATVGVKDLLRRKLSNRLPRSDFSSVSLVMLLIAMLVSGARRVHQLGYLESDPVVARFSGLARLPSVRSLSRWLGRCEDPAVEALAEANAEITSAAVQALKLKTLTVDVDGSVVSTGLTVESARRGFNPHHRKVPSYYPITAYEARSGLILRCQNRPGNVHDGKASLEFLDALITQIEDALPARPDIEMRMDGAFFRQDVLDHLGAAQAGYAIKVPFYRWLGLKEAVAARQRWRRIDAKLSYFEIDRWIESWQRRQRVIIYRKKVAHETRKNFQLDLFDPDDGHYEYSAVTTNLGISGGSLWQFMAGRGTHEQAYAELKSGFAFDAVPSQSYAANSAWQQLNIIAFNLVRRFQMAALAEKRTTNQKRRTVFKFSTIRTLRYQCFSRAGVLTRPGGRQTLDIGTAPLVRSFFERVERRLLTSF